jgi:small-conductance mechanosensitive channel
MKVYDSLKEVVQETLQRSKPSPTPPGPVKGNNASTLNDAVEELENLVAYRIGKLKVAVKESAALVASEAQHAEQVIDGLKTNVAVLEAKLRESEDVIRGKELADQKTEESFNARIAALEAKLKETDEIVRAKDATIKSLGQNNSAKIHELENQLKNKEKLLTNRSMEVIDLKSHLELLRNGVKKMSSFFKQSEVLAAAIEGQVNTAVSREGESKTAEEKPAGAQAQGKPMGAPAPDAVQQNVSPEFFKQLTLELTQTIGPMAPLIVRDHVKSLGETMEQFPKARVRELLETVSSEILDEKVKTGFRERIAQINGHA